MVYKTSQICLNLRWLYDKKIFDHYKIMLEAKKQTKISQGRFSHDTVKRAMKIYTQ
jgi:hypothetical protein